MRRSRERRRHGLTLVTIELRATEFAALTRMGFLAAGGYGNPAAVSVALGRLLDRWLSARPVRRESGLIRGSEHAVERP
jgi:hypothetical protein